MAKSNRLYPGAPDEVDTPDQADAQRKPQRATRGESPLRWLRRRRDRQGVPLITMAEFEAGERLALDFARANMQPRVTTSWSLSGGGRTQAGSAGLGVEIADEAMAARERVNAALASVGLGLSDVLVDVCCFETPLEEAERQARWPVRSAKVILQIALQRLGAHYGLISETEAAPRRWGSPDYRPTLRKWASD